MKSGTTTHTALEREEEYASSGTQQDEGRRFRHHRRRRTSCNGDAASVHRRSRENGTVAIGQDEGIRSQGQRLGSGTDCGVGQLEEGEGLARLQTEESRGRFERRLGESWRSRQRMYPY
jgi:hypothetical protein